MNPAADSPHVAASPPAETVLAQGRPVAWRWRTLPKWSEVPEDQEWQAILSEPDFINPHHHEVEPLYAGLSAQRWRHKKRGTTYRLVSIEYAAVSVAEDETSGTYATAWCALGGFHARVQGIIDAGARIVFYRAEADGTPWTRSHREFFDGRFEPIPNEASR